MLRLLTLPKRQADNARKDAVCKGTQNDFLWIVLISEYICLNELDATVMKTDFHSKVTTQELEQLLSIDERVQTLCTTRKDKQSPEEVNEDSVHDRISY